MNGAIGFGVGTAERFGAERGGRFRMNGTSGVGIGAAERFAGRIGMAGGRAARTVGRGRGRGRLLALALLALVLAGALAGSGLGTQRAAAHVSGSSHCDSAASHATVYSTGGAVIAKSRYTVDFCFYMSSGALHSIKTSYGATGYNGWTFSHRVGAGGYVEGYYKHYEQRFYWNEVRFCNAYGSCFDVTNWVRFRADGYWESNWYYS